MSKTIKIYESKVSAFTEKSLALKNKLRYLAIFRLAVFVTTCFLAYLSFGDYIAVFSIVILGIFIFSLLVFKNSTLKRKKAIVDAKIEINHTEIQVLQRNFHHLDAGTEFENPAHFYSNDIDLFGKGSFFQYINRTRTRDGKIKLSKLLTENSTEAIVEKQEVVEELSKKIDWRQHFYALASLVEVTKNQNSITNWITSYKSIFPGYLLKLQLVFSLISLSLIVAIFSEFLTFSYLIGWFFVGLFITGLHVKKTSNLYEKTSSVKEVFTQYQVLLNEIEQEKFTSKKLIASRKIIQSESQKASVIFKNFSKILDAFDNRNNIVIAVFGNGLFLWEIANACKVEHWISNYKHTVKKWFEVVAYFDAQNSLANFKYNHTSFNFPQIVESKNVVDATNLGHPLLDAHKRIDNDFSICKEEFFIITGANMAGKSTFLRTVSLAIVMANCGLPVCAERFTYTPIKLITSMRTTDSLTEEASYFYAELKRLKYIVDQIKEHDYFIILDEILKGTNSRDKAMGSKQFVEKLATSKSTGIIATHDVSLCALEHEFTTIKNYYFDAEITNNELYFDYLLKTGICKNMNASFLLKKMEII